MSPGSWTRPWRSGSGTRSFIDGDGGDRGWTRFQDPCDSLVPTKPCYRNQKAMVQDIVGTVSSLRLSQSSKGGGNKGCEYVADHRVDGEVGDLSAS
jgi:hypothetical protein